MMSIKTAPKQAANNLSARVRFGRSRSSKVIDFWYQSKARMRLPISPS